MVRAILRLVLVVVAVVAIAAFFFGYRWGGRGETTPINRPVATTGSSPAVDTSRAREAGAEIAEKVAIGANRAERLISDAGVTAKIKSKMALDDTLESARINVDTDGTTVTLSGTVATEAQRVRALQLARETEGVTSVVDHVSVSVR